MTTGGGTRRALALCVLVAACATKPEPTPEERGRAAMDILRAAAGTVVRDPARAKEVTAAVDQMQALFDEALEATRAHVVHLRALDADYDTPQAAARDRMAAATTDAEWESLAKARRAARWTR